MISRTEYVMVQPTTTSCNPAPEAPSSVWIVGTATLTMKVSSRAMNWAARTRANSRGNSTFRTQ
ncbi:hypothetical protein [Streptomyces atratus]|uniref:hypothetical protein n=1 Tax=Streptomyces atratus TaxID=1893 RepID=UPI003F53F701